MAFVIPGQAGIHIMLRAPGVAMEKNVFFSLIYWQEMG